MSTATAAPMFIRSDRLILGGGALMVAVAGLAHYGSWNSVLAFVVSAGAVGVLASLVGLASNSSATGSVRARPA